MKIECVSSESGDWSVLMVNGKEFYSGSSIPDFAWGDLIAEFFDEHVNFKTISDQDMEEENY